MAGMAALLGLLLSARCAADDGSFAVSVGFTSDMVMQRGARTAIYGLTATPGAKVSVEVSDDSGGAQPHTVQAVVTPPESAAAAPLAPGSGTANPLCSQRCLAAGHCCQGDISGCSKPSCAMGCIMAGRTATNAACKASCAAAAKAGCTYAVVSPAGPHHLPQDTLQNESFQMCSGGTVLANGTICQSCSGVDAQNRTECEQGCDFGDKAKGAPAVWKAFLPAHPHPGGSFTVTITSSDSATPIVLERVTFGTCVKRVPRTQSVYSYSRTARLVCSHRARHLRTSQATFSSVQGSPTWTWHSSTRSRSTPRSMQTWPRADTTTSDCFSTVE